MRQRGDLLDQFHFREIKRLSLNTNFILTHAVALFKHLFFTELLLHSKINCGLFIKTQLFDQRHFYYLKQQEKKNDSKAPLQVAMQFTLNK